MHLSQLVSSNGPTDYSHGSTRPSMEYLPRSSAGSAVPLISIPKRKRGDDNPPAHTYPRTPQAPLSPPEDESSRCSLPSISSLLEGADSISQNPAAKRQRPNQQTEGDWNRRSMSHGERPALPPTPPLRPDSGFQRQHRSSISSSISPHSAISGSHFTGANPSPATEAPEQRRISAISLSQHSNRSSFSQTSRAPIHETRYQSTSGTATQPPVPYASPVEPPTSATDYYRSSSQSNSAYPPPLTMPIPTAQQQPQQQHYQQSPMSAASTGSSAWQHHHYFHSSNTAAYPLNQDRYICRTCHKAFSRPSSLRIHSHSHTGEKPFRCPHAGCGKAFSVRSNMKRHERGCHSARTTVPAPLVG